METTIKQGRKQLTGKEGNTFSSTNQPTPEQKKEGWQKRREERLLTKAIFERLADGQTLETYVQTLLALAKEGNAKAIDTINRGIEDQVQKTETTITMPTTIEL